MYMDMNSKVTKERKNTQHNIACKNIKIEGIPIFRLLQNRHIIISSSIEPKCDLISYPCCTYIIYSHFGSIEEEKK